MPRNATTWSALLWHGNLCRCTDKSKGAATSVTNMCQVTSQQTTVCKNECGDQTEALLPWPQPRWNCRKSAKYARTVSSLVICYPLSGSPRLATKWRDELRCGVSLPKFRYEVKFPSNAAASAVSFPRTCVARGQVRHSRLPSLMCKEHLLQNLQSDRMVRSASLKNMLWDYVQRRWHMT
jgi:hypothetical protein